MSHLTESHGNAGRDKCLIKGVLFRLGPFGVIVETVHDCIAEGIHDHVPPCYQGT